MFPDRSSTRQRRWADQTYWNEYRAAAARCGLDLARHDPGAVVVDGTGGARPQAFVDGAAVRPGDTIILTDVYTFPYHIVDTLKQISVFPVLPHVSFYRP